MNISVVITSYNEPNTIGKAISQILKSSTENLELIIVAPDDQTINSAKSEISKYKNFKRFKILKDKGIGKPSAINLGVKNASGDILVFTDGDMYIDDNAIPLLLKGFAGERVAGVSGHPVSLDDRNTFWGFSSHLFCYGAHIMRARPERASPKTTSSPMSGYLYAIKMTDSTKKLFPIPTDIRAEDAYISKKITEMGYKINYVPDALAYVKFPKNLSDWIKQKKRSLGGNIQIQKRATLISKGCQRGIIQDISNALIPIRFASSIKEYLYLLGIYPLRLYLWLIIYIQHHKNNYSTGRWEQIKSSKS